MVDTMYKNTGIPTIIKEIKQARNISGKITFIPTMVIKITGYFITHQTPKIKL